MASFLFSRTKLLSRYINHQQLRSLCTKHPTFTHHPSTNIPKNCQPSNLSTIHYRYFCSSQEPKPNKPTEQIGQPISDTTTTQQLTREHLQRSFRRFTHRFTLRIILSLAAMIGTFWYCWDHPNELINLKNRISKIFSEVGTSTLNQKELQLQATEYSKQMIKDVFNDESMQQETKKFFIQILSEQDFLNTISVLLRDLFARDIMIESVKELVINVFNDESVIEQCKKLVGHAISAEENKLILLQTLNEILDDQELNDNATLMANRTIKRVLDDEDIKTLSAVFLQHVLNDESVQQSSSDSLYKIFVGALTPNVFKRKTKGVMEGESHVPHQHIDVEQMETSMEDSAISTYSEYGEGQEEVMKDENLEEQMDEIESVISNHH